MLAERDGIRRCPNWSRSSIRSWAMLVVVVSREGSAIESCCSFWAPAGACGVAVVRGRVATGDKGEGPSVVVVLVFFPPLPVGLGCPGVDWRRTMAAFRRNLLTCFEAPPVDSRGDSDGASGPPAGVAVVGRIAATGESFLLLLLFPPPGLLLCCWTTTPNDRFVAWTALRRNLLTCLATGFFPVFSLVKRSKLVMVLPSVASRLLVAAAATTRGRPAAGGVTDCRA
mmetsp:Transcript_22315/g.53069  ORF Transcript_22315/g.53069 Transcript_22315/m.53069 type:complete len:227 (+) Transcript_22315:1506-2186(+)